MLGIRLCRTCLNNAATYFYFFIPYFLAIFQPVFKLMKAIVSALIVFMIMPYLSYGQTLDKTANEAYILVRMVNKFHVEPRELNSAFSIGLFNNMLNKADPEKLFFTKNDINRLGIYSSILDKEIKQRKTGYLALFINIYSQRLAQADSIAYQMAKRPFDFYAAEKLTAAEDTSYPASVTAMLLKLHKKVKAEALTELTDNLPGKFKSLTAPKQKQYLDSATIAVQKKVTASFQRKINSILHNPYGLTHVVGNIYCEAIASIFDPHTEFFPPDEKENFESELGKQPFVFGFKIKANKNGGVLIDNLQPGSPAYKSGKLNKGDKFMTMQWEGGQPVDVSDVTIHEFTSLMDESNHKIASFTMKKLDGSIIQVALEKEQVTGDDDDKVKSFILKGENTVGYIYLPAFYQDWEDNNDGLNGCANDVGREILKLKKENINGLILDLRYNGGGSVQEATELAGIFIDGGPVAQVKGREAKVFTLKDADRGTIYDGPLVILVNGYSASASELVAGTLQDYNRAVIVGAPTYGKATMQMVLPMDTSVNQENYAQTHTENYLKVTISKLYRVTGNSAQFKGVQPDIVLPDVLDAYITKEADEPFALRPNIIGANKYYVPSPPLPIKTLAQSVQTAIDTNSYFKAVKKIVTASKQKSGVKDLSLNLKDALADYESDIDKDDGIDFADAVSKKFTVQNNQYELERLRADPNLTALNEEFSKQIAADADIKIAFEVLATLKKL